MNSPEMTAAGRLSCALRVDACLEIVARRNDELRALITVDADGARAEARRLDDDLLRRGPETSAFSPGPSFPNNLEMSAPDGQRLENARKGEGLIVSLKDNIDTAGLRTTIGSRFFADNVPAKDAEVTRRLRVSRGIILGKANMHEFAFGATSQNPHHGACRNPWNPDCIPGGSSGGSGASVAAGMCEASLGTDTGGSVRIPAALNGVVGLRPTPGRISNRGVMPSSPRFDTVGPFARRAVWAAALYEAVAGYDPLDPDSVDRPVEKLADEAALPLRAARIGVPAHFLDQADPEVGAAVLAAVDVLNHLGAKSVALDVEEAQATHDQLASVVRADAARVQIGRLEGCPEIFGADVLARFRQGLATTPAEYRDGLAQLGRWTAHVTSLFDDVDLIATPTVGFAAPAITAAEDMTIRTHALTRMTFVWSFAGAPAISIPCGFTEAGLPVGLQLIGRPWSEARLLAIAAAFQEVTVHHLRRPPDSPQRPRAPA